MSSRDDRLTDLLVRWEEACASGVAPPVEAFCEANSCTDLLNDFRVLIDRIGPLQLESLFHYDEEVDWTPGGRFRVTGVLGRGGLGIVYVANDAELDRTVVIRRMRRSAAIDLEARARFLREARITARLDHPGIVPIYNLTSGPDGEPYYAMRRVFGRPLLDAIDQYHHPSSDDRRERSVEFRRLLRAFISACETVAYAHGQGVVHSDLRPHNILLGSYGETIVINWGFARELETSENPAWSQSRLPVAPPVDVRPISGAGKMPDPTKEVAVMRLFTRAPTMDVPRIEPSTDGVALGAWAYLSPEQASGAWDRLGPQSDIFGLGATLFHILTNRAPYGGEQGPDAVRAGRYASPRQVKPDVPAPLDAICMRAMTPEPGGRYRDARDLARDVERWLADEPVSVYRDPFKVRALRWFGRRQSITKVCVAIVVLGFLALGALGLFLDYERSQAELAEQETARARDAAAAARQRTRNALDATTFALADRLASMKRELRADERSSLVNLLRWYQEFADEAGDGVDARSRVASAYFHIGAIQTALGNNEASAAAYHEAAERYGRLCETTTGADKSRFERERERAAAMQKALSKS